MAEIRKLIEETRRWRELHRAHGRRIEAAACAIREQALLDALEALERSR